MPTPKPPRRKRKPPTRTYALDKFLTGDLEGYHVVMGSMSGREMIRVRSGEFTEGEAIDLTASKVIEHDFDVSDIRDIDGQDLLAISKAWSDAIKDAAVPPEQGNS